MNIKEKAIKKGEGDKIRMLKCRNISFNYQLKSLTGWMSRRQNVNA